MARQNWCILDTETTGLGAKAEIVQIAAIDYAGNKLIDSLVKPTVEIEPKAYRVHGISQARVERAKPFDLVLLDVLKAVGDREVVVYNSSFDLRMIHQSLQAHGLHFRLPEKSWFTGARVWCVMRAYSQWVGEWDYRRRTHKWQKLPGGDHSAVGDCRATLEVIRRMAEG